MTQRERLILLSTERGLMQPDGRVVAPQTLLDDATAISQAWDGTVSAILEPGEKKAEGEEAMVVPAELPFDLEVMPYDDPRLAARIASAAVVLGSPDDRQQHIAALCRGFATAFVVNIDMTLDMRRRRIADGETSLLRRWHRGRGEARRERAVLQTVALATGVHCNGMPSFEAYRALNPNTMLYFDCRTTAEMLPDEDRLGNRLAAMLKGEPLRIGFVGRLTAVDGADQLPQFAAELRRRAVPFSLSVCGSGGLEIAIRDELSELDLCGRVTFKGDLDFSVRRREWMTDELDVILFPYGHGEPTRAYLEALACGVPIVGYDNPAWRGLCAVSDGGFTVPVNDPGALARSVARLHDDRDLLARLSLAGWQFAAEHTFETTLRERMQHLRACAGMEDSEPATV